MVAEGARDEPDLVRGDHVAVELVRRVGEVGFKLRVRRPAGSPVAPGHVLPGRRQYGSALLGDLRPDAVDVVADVDPVRHRLRVRIVLNDVIAEEPDGLGTRGRGQADEEGVEVLDDLPPDIVD